MPKAKQKVAKKKMGRRALSEEYIDKDIKDLIPADYNPRSISEKALTGLKNCIEEFGVVQVPIWNRVTGNIVGGHKRIEALLQLGKKRVRVKVVDLSPTKEMKLNVSLNNKGIQGEFTPEVNDILEELREFDNFDKLNLGEIAFDLPPLDLGDGEGMVFPEGEDVYEKKRPGPIETKKVEKDTKTKQDERSESITEEDEKMVECPECGCKF